MKLKIFFSLIALVYLNQACGVRGDPVPPKTAPVLGRGQPTYKGATQELAFPTVPPVYAPKAKDKEDENEKK
jgi:hypothetical protein